MSERIIGLYEQNEKDLEGKFNQGATDFKLLAFEQYFNLVIRTRSELKALIASRGSNELKRYIGLL